MYHDILANVDVLHGVAESFLTITNLLIIQGFRSARSDAISSPQLIPLPSLSSSSLSSSSASLSSSSVTEAEEEERTLSKTTSNNDSVDDNNNDNTLVFNSNNNMNSQQDVVNKNLVDDIMNVFQRYKFSVFLLFPTVIVLLNYWKDSGIISTLFASSSSLSSSSSLPFLSTIIHKEPLNALSLPTWIIHTSSLLEWLAAMQLIWDHAKVSNNPRWKGLTWAMIPSHTSGICACTYHLFYNSPVLLSLVSFQATFTVLGNIFLAIAAYRIYKYEYKQLQQVSTNQQLSGQQQQDTQQDILTSQTTTAASYLNPINSINNYPIVITTTTSNDVSSSSSSSSFWLNLFIKSTLFAIIIKYGELYSDIPFEPSLLVALSIISALTMTNVLKWISSSSSSSNISDNLLYPM